MQNQYTATMAPSIEEPYETASGLNVPTKALNSNGIKKLQHETGIDELQLDTDEKHDLVLRVFRCLIADLCQQFNGGHPGYVLSK